MFLAIDAFITVFVCRAVNALEDRSPFTIYNLFAVFKWLAWLMVLLSTWSLGKISFTQDTEMKASFFMLMTALFFYAQHYVMRELSKSESLWVKGALSNEEIKPRALTRQIYLIFFVLLGSASLFHVSWAVFYVVQLLCLLVCEHLLVLEEEEETA
jgi:hypothetical protein